MIWPIQTPTAAMPLFRNDIPTGLAKPQAGQARF
jgi:hypothetical protein